MKAVTSRASSQWRRRGQADWNHASPLGAVGGKPAFGANRAGAVERPWVAAGLETEVILAGLPTAGVVHTILSMSCRVRWANGLTP